MDTSTATGETAAPSPKASTRPAQQAAQHTEQQEDRQERLVTALSHWNRALTRSRSETQLLHELCRILVDELDCRFAWVGEAVTDAACLIHPRAQAGGAHGYLDEVSISWGPGAGDRRPAGDAIRTGRPSMEPDIARCPESPWRTASLARGFRAVLAVPLQLHGRVWGAVVAYRNSPQAFSEEDVALFTQLADNLDFGLTALRMQEENLRTRRELEAREAHFRLLLENTDDLIAFMDSDGTLRSASPSVHRVLGLAEHNFVGRKLFELLHPDELSEAMSLLLETVSGTGKRPARRMRLRHVDGSWRNCDVAAVNMSDRHVGNGFVLNIRDTTERDRLEADLKFMAFHDPLTGLGNRRKLQERLTRLLETRDVSAAFIYLDFDRFKVVNDNLGRNSGDKLLRQISARLRECLGDDALVVRLGGDEFGVLTSRLHEPGDAEQVATWLLENIREPFHVEGKTLHLRATAGVCLIPRDAADHEEVLRKAAAALHEARREGAAYRFYDRTRDRFAGDGLQLEEALQEAIEQNAFTLVYQPIFSTDTSRPVGAEALSRWHHARLGSISPARFIPLAEESGLIVDFDRLVMGNLLTAMTKERHRFAGWISMNLSARSFHDPRLTATLRNLLEKTGYRPDRLVLEITETTAMIEPAVTTRVLNELKRLGVRIAVDDFGVGYSSLAYLRDFPVDLVKIDKDFVQGLGQGQSDEGIVRSILALARELGIETLAEGVETEPQLRWLASNGCRYVQGFLLGRPQSVEALRQLEPA